MRALSIRQPWAWAIVHAGKRVENREWTWAPLWREMFLIHATKPETLREFGQNIVRVLQIAKPSDAMTFLAPLASARHSKRADCPGLLFRPAPDLPIGAIVGRARLIGAHHRAPSPWAIPGQLHLILADVERIAEPIPYKGALGFFGVPDELLAGATWEPCS